jgi:hypothetical protein
MRGRGIEVIAHPDRPTSLNPVGKALQTDLALSGRANEATHPDCEALIETLIGGESLGGHFSTRVLLAIFSAA